MGILTFLLFFVVTVTGIFAAEATRELEAVLKVLPRGDDSARTRHYLKLIAAGRQVPEEKQLFTPIWKERKYDEQATTET
jgi:hypothetical protein